MKIYKEESLRNFEFWSGAQETANALTSYELDTIESMLEDQNPDGMDETELNDFFRFESDTIAEWLGYSDWEEFEHKDDEEEAEEEEDENSEDKEEEQEDEEE